MSELTNIHTPIKYVDILTKSTICFDRPTVFRESTGHNKRCLIWSRNWETATVHVNSLIHPNAFIVWFQMYWDPLLLKPPVTPDEGGRLRSIQEYIRTYELANCGEWRLVQQSPGSFKFTNHNPFSPSSSNGAKNEKTSVFPQNIKKDEDTWLAHLHENI